MPPSSRTGGVCNALWLPGFSARASTDNGATRSNNKPERCSTPSASQQCSSISSGYSEHPSRPHLISHSSSYSKSSSTYSESTQPVTRKACLLISRIRPTSQPIVASMTPSAPTLPSCNLAPGFRCYSSCSGHRSACCLSSRLHSARQRP